ncbi:hypothetical protein CXB51_010884 [Gossypium anomalum]|uniref:50S ribosomal protein L21, chloroplastic n=1 Tax=Gossypium anomalum TaxID=47600 RepID=A0A8J5Z3E9_9ROSI|nr:hypothetical protein CXB51_010884 [Gossypium anomalum]
MASSATFSTWVLSSSLATQCNVSNRHHQSCFLSSPPKTPIFSIPKPVSLKLTSPPLLSKTPTFFTIPKSSESDAAVVDVETDNVEPEPEPEAAPEPEPEPASVVEASKEEPKREEIFAVVMIGGRQYIVFPGRYLYTQRLKGANVNDKVGDSDFLRFLRSSCEILFTSGTVIFVEVFEFLARSSMVNCQEGPAICRSKEHNEVFACYIEKTPDIVLNKVLLVGTKTTTYIGKPVVTNAAVHAVVEEQGLNPKVVVFKYKKKKNYRRNIGHRQPNTRIRITGITGYQDYPAVTLES